jgi:hypothetical protein
MWCSAGTRSPTRLAVGRSDCEPVTSLKVVPAALRFHGTLLSNRRSDKLGNAIMAFIRAAPDPALQHALYGLYVLDDGVTIYVQ